MKGRIISWIIYLLSMALMLYCFYRVYTEYSYWAVLGMFFAAVIAIPLCSILHELGHMLFGACVKIKATPKFTSWRKFMDAASCEIKPKTHKNLRCKLIFTTSGGLFINAFFVILGAVALCVPAVPTYLSAFLWYSVYLLVFNLLPLNLDYGKTDGLVIYELIKNDDNSKVMLAVLAVQAQILNGKPIEEIDEKLLFDVPVIQEDDRAFISLTELRYEYFKAKGDKVQAQNYGERFEQLKNTYLDE